ncbi:hypothetical protein PO909_022563 [Leuciscus waleckii]
MVDPVQNLGDSFYCNIEKVYLCTGADGYVPKYNPTKSEFGCLADSPSLLYRFKIIDKAQPETQAKSFGDMGFKALLAVDDPSALSLVKQPGSDGFRLDSTPLFQVAVGREWFIHTIYTVRSKDNAKRGIGKRSVEYHSITSGDLVRAEARGRSRRSNRDVPILAEEIGPDNNRGTNIMRVALDRRQRRSAPGEELFADGLSPRELSGRDAKEDAVTVAGVLVGLLLTILVGVVLALMVRSKRTPAKKALSVSSSLQPVIVRCSLDNGDSSEV